VIVSTTQPIYYVRVSLTLTPLFGVGQFLSGFMGQLYPGGDTLFCENLYSS